MDGYMGHLYALHKCKRAVKIHSGSAFGSLDALLLTTVVSIMLL